MKAKIAPLKSKRSLVPENKKVQGKIKTHTIFIAQNGKSIKTFLKQAHAGKG